MRFPSLKLLPVVALTVLGAGYSSMASATLDVCDTQGANCGWSLTVTDASGTPTTKFGSLSVNPTTGAISLDGLTSIDANGISADVSGFSAFADPSMGFSFSANNTTNGAATYAFSFSLPISLTGPMSAASSLLQQMTSTNAAGGAVFLTSQQHIVVAQDTDLDPLIPLSINKGVDIGLACSTGGAPGLVPCGPFPSVSNASFGTPGTTYELMSATVAFGLTRNSSTSGSVFITQSAVPEPSTYALMMAGLAFVGFVARRRLNS